MYGYEYAHIRIVLNPHLYPLNTDNSNIHLFYPRISIKLLAPAHGEFYPRISVDFFANL
jgi:hypothetical protein